MVEKGYDTAVCASSGSAALSLSAFMYMNGLKAKVFVGSTVKKEKLDLIRIFEPEIEIVEGDKIFYLFRFKIIELTGLDI
jgi:threonine synthase